MGSVLFTIYNAILQQGQVNIVLSLFTGAIMLLISSFLTSFLSHRKYTLKRFIRIQIRKRMIDPHIRGSRTDAFTAYYQKFLCHSQQTNDELLKNILQKNRNSRFLVDRSISFSSSIAEFREKVPLTTYDDYRNYVDQMVVDGAQHLLSPKNYIYFATSSGTTGNIKLIPICADIVEKYPAFLRVAFATIWRSLPSYSFPAYAQRSFSLQSGKKASMCQRSSDGTPIGPLTQIISVASSFGLVRKMTAVSNVVALDLIESIDDFDTSLFVQLVFALMMPDINSYAVIFTPAFIHTVKMIEKRFEEMCYCISSANFNDIKMAEDSIANETTRASLSQALEEVADEYGGMPYRLQRAEHVRNECRRADLPGLLHRLWPTLVYVSTTTGGSFTMYKQEIQFYCGSETSLINHPLYLASEGLFGILASIHTDEYFLAVTSVFFEFIEEEDIHQAQPKTLLISEIEPGKRYELVCTTEPGFMRYRMGDVINCTRYLSRATDLVPLSSEPVEIPRIPLITIAYRIGTLLDIYGEKTTEHHITDALHRTVNHWKEQHISTAIRDFTAYPKLDVFPAHYVIFVELIEQQDETSTCHTRNQNLAMLKKAANTDLDRNLAKVHPWYGSARDAKKLDSLTCIFVQSGTFSTFLNKELVHDQVGPIQIKPHRLLKNEDHVRFFYEHQIASSS